MQSTCVTTAMTSLAEVFNHRESSNLMTTYGETEGGFAIPSYQLSIAVSANLSNTRQRKLVQTHFSRNNGYDSCVVNQARNMVTISSIEGIVPDRVVSYIRRHVDSNAMEVHG